MRSTGAKMVIPHMLVLGALAGAGLGWVTLAGRVVMAYLLDSEDRISALFSQVHNRRPEGSANSVECDSVKLR